MLKEYCTEDVEVTFKKSEFIDLINYCIKRSSILTEQFPSHLNIKQLSRYLNYSEPAIYKMVAEASIPNYKLSGKLLFKKAEIDDWLSDFKQPTIKNRISELDCIRK